MERLRLYYRHSRVSGNPEVSCHKPACLTQYCGDSRLRGKDGFYI